MTIFKNLNLLLYFFCPSEFTNFSSQYERRRIKEKVSWFDLNKKSFTVSKSSSGFRDRRKDSGDRFICFTFIKAKKSSKQTEHWLNISGYELKREKKSSLFHGSIKCGGVRTWVALLSVESFSPEDTPSLLALGALSEVSDEGGVLPGECRTRHNTFLTRLCSAPTWRRGELIQVLLISSNFAGWTKESEIVPSRARFKLKSSHGIIPIFMSGSRLSGKDESKIKEWWAASL